MSSSAEKLKRKSNINGRSKKSFNFCSTPVLGKTNKPDSISVSAVDTNSSSSTKEKRREIVAKDVEKKQKKKTKLKQKKLKQKTEDINKTEERNTEKKIKKKKKKKRPKEKIIQIHSDENWETCDEVPRQSSIRNIISRSGSDILFGDLKSPEKIREAPHFVEECLESPILRPRKWEIESPEKINFEENELLPLKDLPLSYVQYNDSDDEDDELFLKKENVIKTYLGIRNKKQIKNDVRIEKCKSWLVDVSVPTTKSDFLWENFVKDNHENIGRYLKSPVYRTDMSSVEYPKKMSNENEKSIKMQYEEKIARKKEDFKSNRIYKEMDTVRGHWDKSSKKWIRVYDQYKYPENEDNECKGMTLNQFLHKCKNQKEHVIELTSSSSSIQQNYNNINQKFEDLRSSPSDKRKRKKKNIENFQPKSKKSRKMILDVSDSELQRINRVRRFASRLFEKERKMYNMSPTISKDTKSEYTVFPLKK
ncbi:hypothetical protein HZU67_08913 [Apis mellifera carnica]|nr:hypothetical protein HZU67_08913 [Apis mellifera carnica]